MPYTPDSGPRTTDAGERTHISLAGALPTYWAIDTGGGQAMVVLGPIGASGRAARLTIETLTAAGTLEDSTQRLIEQVRSRAGSGLVASCDIWPHRQWGTGRLVQSAHVVDDTTMAHDVYLFVDGDRELRVTVSCALGDLLTLEEDIARIVGQVRTTNMQGVSPDGASRRPGRGNTVRRHLRVARTRCAAGDNAGAL